MSILKTKKIFTYMVVGALVSALFISCGKNPAEPEGNGGADFVPTFTGEPATDLSDGYYQGTLSYKAHNISEFSVSGDVMTREEFEQGITSDKTFYLKIANNKLKWEEYEQGIEDETTTEKEALKSGSEYGATIEYGENNEQGSAKEKKTVKFTISGDTISITYIEGQSADGQIDDGVGNMINLKYSYDATYGGTLTKYTPTPLGN